jgi:hypothetical protein
MVATLGTAGSEQSRPDMIPERVGVEKVGVIFIGTKNGGQVVRSTHGMKAGTICVGCRFARVRGRLRAERKDSRLSPLPH